MAETSTFSSMGSTQHSTSLVRELGIGMLGYAFMGKAHSNAFKKAGYIYWPPVARARLVSLCGRNAANVAEAARRYGFDESCTDWHDLISDDRIHIFDNCGPNNLHHTPTIAAARAGKHIICEKPLARSAAEAKEMWDAVRTAGVKHLCAFNYRFVPAIRLARQLIEDGRLGQIYHFRASYLQEWIMDPAFPMVWRLDASNAGSGALGDLGAHVIDLARYLVGEPRTVSGLVTTFIKDRQDDTGQSRPVTVDDAFESMIEFQNGAIGTIEASRFCLGRKNYQRLEINGSKGSLVFNLERLNELEVHLPGSDIPEAQGFRSVLVTEAHHPYYSVWWPHGHTIGWENTFVHEVYHFMDSIVNNTPVTPDAADFEDGYRCAVICDAIVESSRSGQRLEIVY